MKHLKDPKEFIECSNDIRNFYKNITHHNSDKDWKKL